MVKKAQHHQLNPKKVFIKMPDKEKCSKCGKDISGSLSFRIGDVVKCENCFQKDNPMPQVRSCLGEIRELRRLLWVMHLDHFHDLYSDDGRMQCPKCMIDFKRDNIRYISKRLAEAREEFYNRKGVDKD